MKFRLIILSVFLLIPTLIAAQKRSPHPVQVAPDDYIGYKYVGVSYNKKLPNGVRDRGGNLLDNENYGISRMKKGHTEMLWLARITGRNSQGVPSWEVQDVLILPGLKAGQEILQGFRSTCTLNDTEDLSLVVLAQPIPEKKIYQVEKAWRADTVTGKFQEIETGAVVCEYDDL